MIHVLKAFAKKHAPFFPEGVGSLFLIQLFSTIGYAAISSSLVLYATNWLRFPDAAATSIVASFVALNFALHLVGGSLGGRLLSFRSLFAIGMVFQFTGCVVISMPSSAALYWGLAAFLTGVGLNVACINCMLTQLFKPDDKHRETAFFINYSAMNVGASIGFFLGGYFHLSNAYQDLFLISSVGNLTALICAAVQWKYLKDINTPLSSQDLAKKFHKNLFGLLIIVCIFFSLRWLLDHADLTNNMILVLGVFMTIVISYLASRQKTTVARNKMIAYLVLAFASLVFWTLYQLAPLGLTLFIERNVDRHYLGMLVPPQWAQNLNPIIIMIGGPLLGWAFTKMREHGYRISVPFQFALSLFFIGIGFAVLPLAISLADPMGYSNFNWILICYFFQSLGELIIGPVGYAMIGQYAPARLQGLLMGTWMMISGVSAVFAGHFSKLALGMSKSTDPLITNPTFSNTFVMLSFAAIASGALILILRPYLIRLTHENESAAA